MRKTTILNLIAGTCLLGLSGQSLAGDDFSIDWWTIDSGGIMESSDASGDWQLAGTIGQWDASAARELSGGQWRLTGGFWGLTLEELGDLLFGDRFESAED